MSTNQPPRLLANSTIRCDRGVWSNTVLLIPDKDHCDGLLDIKCCHELGNEKWIRWEGIRLVVVEGGRGVGREIDLSPAAKSHCMCLSDREHYSQSQWINLPAAPHELFASFPPDKWSHSPAVHDGTFPIKAIWSGRCLRICFAAFRLRGSSSSATLTKTWLNAVMSRFWI